MKRRYGIPARYGRIKIERERKSWEYPPEETGKSWV